MFIFHHVVPPVTTHLHMCSSSKTVTRLRANQHFLAAWTHNSFFPRWLCHLGDCDKSQILSSHLPTRIKVIATCRSVKIPGFRVLEQSVGQHVSPEHGKTTPWLLLPVRLTAQALQIVWFVLQPRCTPADHTQMDNACSIDNDAIVQ